MHTETPAQTVLRPWAGNPAASQDVVRLACRACGVHTVTQRTLRLGGQCGNCGSYDLAPLAEAPRGSWAETRRA